MQTGPQNDQGMVRGLELPSPQPSGRGEKARDGVNIGSCLHDKASIKIPKLWGSGFKELSGWWTPTFTWGGWCSPPPQKERPLHYGPSGSFIMYVPYNKLINVNKHVSLSSVNHYSKLWNLRRSLWEPQSGTLLVRHTGVNLNWLAISIWMMGGLYHPFLLPAARWKALLLPLPLLPPHATTSLFFL